MEFNLKNILLIGAHPDDIEFGMGASLAKFKENKKTKFKVVVFANCEEQPGNAGITEEFKESMKFFGIKNYDLHDLPNTHLPEYSSDIRSILESTKSSFIPDAVFATSKGSIHQDHKIVAEEVERVFRNFSCFSYEDVKSSPNFKPNFYCALERNHIRSKIRALSLYRTQYRRYYHDDDLITSLARFRGGQMAIKYAESFEMIRCVC